MFNKNKGIVGILVTIVMLMTFCVPTIAMGSATEALTDNQGVYIGDTNEIDLPAGRVFVNELYVYAYKTSTNTEKFVASQSWPNGNATPNLTIPLSTFSSYANNGYDKWIIRFSFTIQGSPNTLQIYENNIKKSDGSIWAGYYDWEMTTTLSQSTQQFRLTLDNSGATCVGNVFIQ
jgi:hypothetical protein